MKIEKLAQGARQRTRFCDGISEEQLSKLSKNERGRQEAIFELIQTEQNYVQDLSIIVNEFVKPLQTKEILPKEEIYNICINLDVIYPISQKFLEDLQNRQSQSLIVEDISDIILKHQPNFDQVYIEYCSKHSFALRRVNEYTDKFEKFKEFMLQPKPAMKETLQGYLVKPFQRITRYTMLTQSILKNVTTTNENSKEKLNLNLAYYQFKNIATKANSQLRQEEERVKAIEVWNFLQQSQSADSLILQSSQFPIKLFQKLINNKQLVSEFNPMSLASFYGKASIQKNNNNTTMDGYLFLFNDCLLITKGKDKKSIQLISRIPIQDIRIISSPKPLLPLEINMLNQNTKLSLIHSSSSSSSSSSSLSRQKKSMKIRLLIENHSKNENEIIKIQCFLRMIKERKDYLKQKNNFLKLQEIFKNMLEKEQEFQRKISIIQEIITPLINNDDLRELFYDITELPLINQYSLKIIETIKKLIIIENNHKQPIIKEENDKENQSSDSNSLSICNFSFDFFVNLKLFFQLWVSIIDTFRKHIICYGDINNDIISLPQERPDLFELIKNSEKSKNQTPGSYTDLLEQPSFHIQNYLQFSEQIKNILSIKHLKNKSNNENKENFNLIVNVFNQFKLLNEFCNKLREKIKNSQRLINIITKLNYDGLEEDGRTFIREGSSIYLIPEENEKNLYLFNDILIISDSKSNKIRNIIYLSNIFVFDLNDTHFQIIDNTNKSFIFKTLRNIHKRRWLKDILETIENLQSNSIQHLHSQSSNSLNNNSNQLIHNNHPPGVDDHSFQSSDGNNDNNNNSKKLYSSFSSRDRDRSKRSASVFENPMKKIIFYGSGDIWHVHFTENQKHIDEFSELLKNSLENISKESIHSNNIMNNNNLLLSSSSFDKFDKLNQLFNQIQFNDDKKFILLPLMKQILSIYHKDLIINEYASFHHEFIQCKSDQSKMRFDFIANKILQQPKSILLAPPKLPVSKGSAISSTSSSKHNRRWVQRPQGSSANSSRIIASSSLSSNNSDVRDFPINSSTSNNNSSSSSSSSNNELNSRIQSLESNIKNYQNLIQSSSSRIDFLENQQLLFSDNISSYSEKIKNLEKSNESLEISFTNQQKELNDLREKMENYMNRRKRKKSSSSSTRQTKKSENTKNKKNKNSESSDISVSVSQSIDVSPDHVEPPSHSLLSDNVDMPDIFPESSSAMKSSTEGNKKIESSPEEKNNTTSSKKHRKPRKRKSAKNLQKILKITSVEDVNTKPDTMSMSERGKSSLDSDSRSAESKEIKKSGDKEKSDKSKKTKRTPSQPKTNVIS